MPLVWEFEGHCDATPPDNWDSIQNTTVGGTWTLNTSDPQEGTGDFRMYYPATDAYNYLAIWKAVTLHPSCVLKYWFQTAQIPDAGGGPNFLAQFTDTNWYSEWRIYIEDAGSRLVFSNDAGDYFSTNTMSASTWYEIEVDWTATHVTVKVDGTTWIDEDVTMTAAWAVGSGRQLTIDLVGEPAGDADIQYYDDVRYGYITAGGFLSYVTMF